MSEPPDKTWQELFRHHTMRTNFQLGLTRPQLEFLCSVAENCWWNRAIFKGIYAPDNFIAAGQALVRRGLVVEKTEAQREKWNGRDLYEIRSRHELTDAGWLVVELLKLTGLFVTADLAIERKSATAKSRRIR